MKCRQRGGRKIRMSIPPKQSFLQLPICFQNVYFLLHTFLFARRILTSFLLGLADCRRLDELEKTLESMRKSLEYGTSPTTKVDNTFAAGNSFGHPLDMLARTAANTHSHNHSNSHSVSPELDRFPPANAYSGITPPAQTTQRSSLRIATTDAIPTTWSTDLSGIDPVERGWMDLDDAKAFFERYVSLERSIWRRL